MSLALIGPGDGGRFGRSLRQLRRAARRSGLLRGVTLKVAIFAVVCLVILVGLAAKIGNISFFSHRVQYQALLANANELQPSSPVKIAGVTVGQVDAVTVHHGDALVTFSVNRSVHLPADTKVGTQWQDVVGNQFLYLYPGHARTLLRPHGRLGLAADAASPNIGALLDTLQPVVAALDPTQGNQVIEAFVQALSGNESQINNLVDSAAAVSQTVGSLDTQVGQLVTQLDQVFSALSQRSGDLTTVIDNFQTVGQSLASNNGLLDQTVSNLATAAREVAQMVAGTKGNLSSAISQLNGVTGTIQANDGALATGLSTAGKGVAPYTLISNYGQWFSIRSVYTCLAGQQVCTYYDSGNPPAGSGPGGSPPLSGTGAAASPASAGAPSTGAALPAVPGLAGAGAGAGGSAPSGVNALAALFGLSPTTGAGGGGGGS